MEPGRSSLSTPVAGRALPALALTVAVLALLTAVPTSAQLDIFDDAFETNTMGQWSVTVPPSRIDCDCYFSSDCASGTFCNYGPGGFGTEDICNWVDLKPSGNPGFGCDTQHVGPWGGDICDGICSATETGSVLGGEDRALVRRGIDLWRDAMLLPAVAGGGPIDAALAAEAEGLPFRHPDSGRELGRFVADALVLTAALDFYHQFCAHDNGKPPSRLLIIDLSGDPCRAEAGRLAAEALAAEVTQPGSGAPMVGLIGAFCPDWQNMFEPHCASGAGALDCLNGRIVDLATALRTPSVTAVTAIASAAPTAGGR